MQAISVLEVDVANDFVATGMRDGTNRVEVKERQLRVPRPPAVPTDSTAEQRRERRSLMLSWMQEVERLALEHDARRAAAQQGVRRSSRCVPTFKAELVAACLVPGTFIAAFASSHGMNANVLHRWLKGHARTGCHQPIVSQPPSKPAPSPSMPEFIPLCLPNATAEAVATELKVELRKGAQSMTLTWPMQAAADFVHFAQWADLPKD